MDTQVKKRGWVKNAVIIFLAIMLVLTFFSNTIMNRSLAEVSTQYISSGSISAKVRGTGTIVANVPYEVSINEGRVVQSVLVKVGDHVEVGDTLIRFTEDADTRLKEAEEQLDNLKYNYRLFLLGMADRDYSRENREISKMKQEIAELEADLSKLAVSENDIAAAKIAVESAQTAYDDAMSVTEAAQKALDDFDAQYGASSGDVSELYEAYAKASEAYDAANLQYGEDDEIFRKAAEAWMKNDVSKDKPYISSYYEALNNIIVSGEYSTYDFSNNNTSGDVIEKEVNNIFENAKNGTTNTAEERAKQCALAYRTVRDAEAALAKASDAYKTAAIDSYISKMRSTYEDTLKSAKEVSDAAQKELEKAKEQLEDLNQKKSEYKTANDAIDSQRDMLEDAIFNLSQTQKSDNKQAQRDQLDLEKMKKELDEQQALVDKLSSGDTIYELTANAAGVVSSINATAGRTTIPEETLMTIDQTDRGYTVSFSVTNEQARRVQVGDHAEVTTSNWWFSGSVDAVLVGVSANPSDPRNSKMLNFSVTGDVTGGDQVTLAIGERSQYYDLIVPKNAVRSDSNGSYVLLLEQKQSVLGNRYYATRIDVEVVVSDDTQSAITGALSAWDYVITSSSMPIEPGDQVRLTEK